MRVGQILERPGEGRDVVAPRVGGVERGASGQERSGQDERREGGGARGEEVHRAVSSLTGGAATARSSASENFRIDVSMPESSSGVSADMASAS